MKETQKRDKTNSPLKAIRAKCLDCCCGSASEVKLCTMKDCDLYPFRFGKKIGSRKKNMTDEQKKAIVERFKKARLEKKKNG